MFVVLSLGEKQLRRELLRGEKHEAPVLFLVLGHEAMGAGAGAGAGAVGV